MDISPTEIVRATPAITFREVDQAMRANRTPDSLESAERLAVTVLRDEYARNLIDHADLERRLSAVMGLSGDDERLRALATTEFVEATRLGDVSPRQIAVRWHWPDSDDETAAMRER